MNMNTKARRVSLIRESGGCGDMLCLCAAGRVVKQVSPTTEVFAFVPEEYIDICEHCEGIDQVVSLGSVQEIHTCRRIINQPLSLIRHSYLRKCEGYDLGKVVDLYCPGLDYEQGVRDGDLCLGRATIFGREATGFTLLDARPVWRIQPEEHQIAESLLKGFARRKDFPLLGIVLTSADLLRCYPFQWWGALIYMLTQWADLVLFDSTPLPREVPHVFPLINKPWGIVASVLALMDGLITVDTAFVHLGPAVGVKTLGLFGSTNGYTVLGGYPNTAVLNGYHSQCPVSCHNRSSVDSDHLDCAKQCSRLMALTPNIIDAKAKELFSHDALSSSDTQVRSASRQRKPAKRRNNCVVVTGCTGFLGTLVARTILQHTDDHVIIPVCIGDHRYEQAMAKLLVLNGLVRLKHIKHRIHFIPFQGMDDLVRNYNLLKRCDVNQIIDCEGSIVGMSARASAQVNTNRIRMLVNTAQMIEAERFMSLSSVYAEEYLGRSTKQAPPIHSESNSTSFTQAAEAFLIESGLPYAVLRSSLIIGDSQTGKCFRPLSGFYQFLAMAQKALRCSSDEFWIIPSSRRINLIHEDFFCRAFLIAYKYKLHSLCSDVVSRDCDLPTWDDLYQIWFELNWRPSSLRIYQSSLELPMERMSPLLRRFYQLLEMNFTISQRDCAYNTKWLDGFLLDGHATRQSVGRCIREYLLDNR